MAQEYSLQETLTRSFLQGMENVYTSIPGIVVTVRDNFQNLSVDVQPAVNIKKEDGTVSERAVVLNVPVLMPSSRDGGLTHNVSVGDSVWLMFSMAGLDTWKRGNGTPVIPSDFRKFDKRDCVAMLSPFPFSESVNNPDKHVWSHDPNDVVLYHNLGTAEETEIRLHRAGGVTINTNQGVTVNAGEFVEVNTKDYTVNTETYTVMASGAVGIYGSRVDIN
ncbi:Gp138 family membrane-puncturing spike protein [Streptomyces sp. G35A]